MTQEGKVVGYVMDPESAHPKDDIWESFDSQPEAKRSGYKRTLVDSEACS